MTEGAGYGGGAVGIQSFNRPQLHRTGEELETAENQATTVILELKLNLCLGKAVRSIKYSK